MRFISFIVFCCLLYSGWLYFQSEETDWKSLTDSQWRQRLSVEQYEVLRESSTEDPYTGELLKEERDGNYLCAGCGTTLFESDAKFSSGTGWPSFDDPVSSTVVTHHRHNTVLAVAVEVRCATCQGHLGHVFPDGPTSTGNRYCTNSAALEFRATEAGP
jgi:peptide-methionine (R)-S-oxide reductase